MSDTMDSTWVAQGLYRAFKIFEKDLLHEDDEEEDEDDKKEDEDEEDEEDDLGFDFSMNGDTRCQSCGKICNNFLTMFRDHEGSCTACKVCTAEQCIVNLKLRDLKKF